MQFILLPIEEYDLDSHFYQGMWYILHYCHLKSEQTDALSSVTVPKCIMLVAVLCNS